MYFVFYAKRVNSVQRRRAFCTGQREQKHKHLRVYPSLFWILGPFSSKFSVRSISRTCLAEIKNLLTTEIVLHPLVGIQCRTQPLSSLSLSVLQIKSMTCKWLAAVTIILTTKAVDRLTSPAEINTELQIKLVVYFRSIPKLLSVLYHESEGH